ncbi:hypothetical protein JB92DRAFT_3140298 [Gautieria morchelliformis]|nr:hypothetical protein JB92DRAFT_3140298 [Gautieria morchelliformis]
MLGLCTPYSLASITFTYVQPGAAKTEFASNASLPLYLSSFLNVGLAVMGQTPASYAEVPFYLLANPVGWAATSIMRFWDGNAGEMAGNPALQDEGTRAAVCDYLMEKMNAAL